MLKLPVCPYCGKKADYRASAKAMRGSEYICKVCKKLSRVRFKFHCTVLAVIMAAIMIGFNTLIFFKGNNATLLPNLIVTVAGIVIYIAITPLTVRFHEIEGQRDPEPKRKKNRHRQKKTKYNDVQFNENPLEGTSFDR